MTPMTITLWALMFGALGIVTWMEWEKYKVRGHSSFAPMGKCWRGHCLCGWQGPARRTDAAAIIDVATHDCPHPLTTRLNIRLEDR